MAGLKLTTGLFAALALGVVLPGVSGCASDSGWAPVYARPAAAGMARIDVEVPNTRTGYLLREQLEDQLAWDRSSPATYRLKLTLHERRRARGLDESRVATRYEVTLTASYVLTDIATGKMVLRGNRPIHITYDTTDQPYAGIVAQQDGQVRAAGQAAEQIKTDLLAWFAEQ